MPLPARRRLDPQLAYDERGAANGPLDLGTRNTQSWPLTQQGVFSMRSSFRRVMAYSFSLMLTSGLGCAVHTHKTVSTYEYGDDRGAPPREVEREHVDSEYHMVAPGTMVVEPAHK